MSYRQRWGYAEPYHTHASPDRAGLGKQARVMALFCRLILLLRTWVSHIAIRVSLIAVTTVDTLFDSPTRNHSLRYYSLSLSLSSRRTVALRGRRQPLFRSGVLSLTGVQAAVVVVVLRSLRCSILLWRGLYYLMILKLSLRRPLPSWRQLKYSSILKPPTRRRNLLAIKNICLWDLHLLSKKTQSSKRVSASVKPDVRQKAQSPVKGKKHERGDENERMDLEEGQQAWAQQRKEAAWRLTKLEQQLETEKASKQKELSDDVEAKITPRTNQLRDHRRLPTRQSPMPCSRSRWPPTPPTLIFSTIVISVP
ncbi:hypothetical protein Taro_048508 [Colocasia esculenta]|uniref:Uncharacterized protein n=1 Tax=Colocasia esculenta TaxID=4460 RepID=A0A843X8B7_COLES|nr:hypothetical protein [Colocasia esculenta]